MKKYTRIKHQVLMEVFAKGRLSKREMQIAFVIIRESWGWNHGQSNWTKNPLTHQEIAERTGLKRNHVTECLGEMIEQNKILVNEGRRYAFNEHPGTWRDVPKRDMVRCPETGHKEEMKRGGIGRPETGHTEGPELGHRTSQNGTKKGPETGLKDVPKKDIKGPESGHCRWWGFDVTSYNLNEIRKKEGIRKEMFKEIFKETLKEIILYLRRYYEHRIARKLRTFDSTREAMISARLENFSVRDLMQVIRNISESDWHMGRDPKSSRAYNSWELLFRNDRQVEEYLNLKKKRRVNGKGRTGPSDRERFGPTGAAAIPASPERPAGLA